MPGFGSKTWIRPHMRVTLRSRLITGLLCFTLGWAGSIVAAKGAGVIDNLNRSRDALLTQRKNLQTAADSLNTRIAELQRQLDSVNSYLRDTDAAVRDVESAMKRY